MRARGKNNAPCLDFQSVWMRSRTRLDNTPLRLAPVPPLPTSCTHRRGYRFTFAQRIGNTGGGTVPYTEKRTPACRAQNHQKVHPKPPKGTPFFRKIKSGTGYRFFLCSDTLNRYTIPQHDVSRHPVPVHYTTTRRVAAP